MLESILGSPVLGNYQTMKCVKRTQNKSCLGCFCLGFCCILFGCVGGALSLLNVRLVVKGLKENRMETTTLYRVILGFHELYWGYMGIMEKKMETTI